VATISSLLADHVTLRVRSVDRLFLQGYVPKLQTAGMLIRFLLDRGFPIPSPALLGKIGRAYSAAIDQFALDYELPVVRFAKQDCKEDVAREYFQRAEREKALPTEDEVGKVISDEKQRAGSQESWQKAIKDSGQTEESLREVVRKRLALQKLLDKVGSKVDAPSDKEIEDFYNNNRQRYVTARGVELSVIYVDPSVSVAVDDQGGELTPGSRNRHSPP